MASKPTPTNSPRTSISPKPSNSPKPSISSRPSVSPTVSVTPKPKTVSPKTSVSSRTGNSPRGSNASKRSNSSKSGRSPKPGNSPATSNTSKIGRSSQIAEPLPERHDAIATRNVHSSESSKPENEFSSSRKLSANKSSSSVNSVSTSGSSISDESRISLNLKIPHKRLKHDYAPKPYTFKMPKFLHFNMKTPKVNCPPFHVLLDHTIAVIWLLFSPKQPTKELGIVHLQWAISFLQAIRNHHGDIPDDVIMCSRAMQERVIELYSDMEDFMSPTEDSKFKNFTEMSDSESQDNFNSFMKRMEKYQGSKPKQYQVITSSGSCYPISFTLKDVIGTNRQVMDEIIQPQCAETTCPDCRSCIVNLPSTSGYRTEEIDESLSNGHMLGVLKNWRQEQVEKIQEELKRLHSIEEFMFTINKDNTNLIDDKVIEQIYAYEKKKEAARKSQ